MKNHVSRALSACLDLTLLVQIGVDIWLTWALLYSGASWALLVPLLAIATGAALYSRFRTRARLRAAL